MNISLNKRYKLLGEAPWFHFMAFKESGVEIYYIKDSPNHRKRLFHSPKPCNIMPLESDGFYGVTKITFKLRDL